jgi:hypothetical protein
MSDDDNDADSEGHCLRWLLCFEEDRACASASSERFFFFFPFFVWARLTSCAYKYPGINRERHTGRVGFE